MDKPISILDISIPLYCEGDQFIGQFASSVIRELHAPPHTNSSKRIVEFSGSGIKAKGLSDWTSEKWFHDKWGSKAAVTLFSTYSCSARLSNWQRLHKLKVNLDFETSALHRVLANTHIIRSDNQCSTEPSLANITRPIVTNFVSALTSIFISSHRTLHFMFAFIQKALAKSAFVSTRYQYKHVTLSHGRCFNDRY